MIEIFVFAFNRPDLFSYQLKCFNKFLKNEFRVHLIYDTRDYKFRKEFSELCDGEKIIYHEHKSEPLKSSSTYHSEALQYAYELSKNWNSSICLFLDHDIFLIGELDLIKEMQDVDILGLKQERSHVNYIWPGLIAFRTESFETINWNCQEVDGQYLDTGGGTYSILRDNKIRYKSTNVVYPDEYKGIDLTNSEITLGYNFELHFNEKFLHSRNACNWNSSYQIQDFKKTDLLFEILNDVLFSKTRKEFEIVVSRYNEDLSWTREFSDYCTIYNKGDDIEYNSVKLKNIGREGHTYIHHIVKNYYNLSDYTVFLQGDPFNPHSPGLISTLNQLIDNSGIIPNFIWISERLVYGDFEYEHEPYHRIFPYIKFAYEKIFNSEPPPKRFTFGAGAQFCVSREKIHSHPKSFYENILSLFETKTKTEDSVKLLGNPGIDKDFIPENPELGLHLERFWGLIFNDGQ
jgi:hypothetical protein